MPTLYDVSGGRDRLLAMTTAFYAKAIDDDVIGEMFGRAAGDHAAYLAGWMCVSFGGPRDYLATRGDLDFVDWKHAGLKITEAERARWARLMMEAAAEVGMPPAFLATFQRYVDGISRVVREGSHVPLEDMRRHLGLAPGEEMSPRSAERPTPEG